VKKAIKTQLTGNCLLNNAEDECQSDNDKEYGEQSPSPAGWREVSIANSE
jgi:hypothetical protein